MAKLDKKASSGIFNFISSKDIGFESIKEVSPVEFSIWIRTLLQGWRQGTVGVKGRADVALTNKKPWKQKGTGRARAGTARSPLWRKGGVTFGPQPRVKELKVNKKLKQRVFNKLFGDLLKNKKVLSLKAEAWEKPSTSKAYGLLKDANLSSQKTLVLVSPNDLNMQASFINLPMVNVITFDQINAFDLADTQSVVFFEKDFDLFKSTVSKWI